MKPGIFTQLYIHLIFAVKNREAVLTQNIRNRVFEYMSGIASNMKHKSIIINGALDHVHILLGLNPATSISDTVHDLKRNSSLLINDEKLCKGKFSWQEGYGGFTYSRSQLNDVYHYIENQEMHHKKRSFREEYLGFLEKFEIEFDQRFLFDFFDDVV
jgi:putative transposase